MKNYRSRFLQNGKGIYKPLVMGVLCDFFIAFQI